MSERLRARRSAYPLRSLAAREAAVHAGELAAAGRATELELREEALDAREQALAAAVEARARGEAQLREANEQLVVATVSAQAMTEVAEQASVRLSYMAEHDFLTGLPNRALLMARLAQSMALARRHGTRVAVLYVDLDHFKHINDSMGHVVGDQLLQSAARRLQGCVRLSDTVSRQGGDEFLVLLAEVRAVHDAASIADKLLKSMMEPHVIGGHELRVTLSIGISLYPDDGDDAAAVLRSADTAMYRAKEKGRNNAQVFTADMDERAVAQRSTEQALHLALQRNEFVLEYQPRVNLETGVITGAEALLRMRQLDRLAEANEFVSAAEECGLMRPIGTWALREACRQAEAWRAAGLDLGRISVNVSATELHADGFLVCLRAILHDTGLDPHRLELELTESSLVQDTSRATCTLRALKELGVGIAVDDFGTGYSSLSSLRRFPIDTLKIDRSFVQDIDGAAGSRVVSAVIAMGTSLEQRVVAAGIETKEQLAFLRSNHCPEGQGFYFSRPVTAEALAAMLPRRGESPVAAPHATLVRAPQ